MPIGPFLQVRSVRSRLRQPICEMTTPAELSEKGRAGAVRNGALPTERCRHAALDPAHSCRPVWPDRRYCAHRFRVQWLATRKDLAATPPPGHLVDIGGYRLHLWCTGDGAPAVILDTGLGGSTAGWGFVQPDVERFTRACSYDRAGMGYSDPRPSPRTARRSRRAGRILARSGIGGPVVLVGPPSRVSTSACSRPITLSAPPVSCSWMPPTKTTHMTCRRMARFVPLLSTIGVLRLFGVSSPAG